MTVLEQELTAVLEQLTPAQRRKLLAFGRALLADADNDTGERGRTALARERAFEEEQLG